jgi:hypothetical protein
MQMLHLQGLGDEAITLQLELQQQQRQQRSPWQHDDDASFD